jgi:NhaP-type Na+/H+ or K+/H+ antiporter
LIGGFVTVFSLFSLFVKEKLYIGEATVAAIFGLIVGPHCLNWFVPTLWGNSDFITIEVSRIVLIVQIFAVAVELPKKYMLRHWLSVMILLLPVMTFGWLISSVFIWKLVPTLSWVEGLVIAACVTATDPVLASAVVGKGKFARRVPGHLRNILSAESGCNDGMAFPFAFLALDLILHAGHHGEIAFEFIVITILYECVFGCVLGAIIGYTGRHLIKFAEKRNLIDRESFLVFYFVLALFCTGVGSILGVDDLLVSFAAGTAFSWDGWFAKKTEESHVSNVIDLLLNMAYFVYFGAIIPWDSFNDASLGLEAWKLVILAILILLFRRIPIVLAMKPFIPDVKTWREALFCGHFGPIGVGAIFISILCRAELEHGEPTPLASLPPPGSPNYYTVATIWPITTFLVISSIIVHGSSIAVFTLGKRLNNMTITMSYTTGGNNQSWLSRLPRIEGGRSLSLHKVDTDDPGKLKFGSMAKPAGGMRRRKKGDTRRDAPVNLPIDLGAGKKVATDDAQAPGEADAEERINDGVAAFQEGHHVVVEDSEGEVLATVESKKGSEASEDLSTSAESSSPSDKPTLPVGKQSRSPSPRGKKRDGKYRQGRKVTAYQLDDDVIVENEDGEIIRRYRINRKHGHHGHSSEAETSSSSEPAKTKSSSIFAQGLERTLSWVGIKRSSGGESSSTGAVHHHVDVEKNEPDDFIPVYGGKDDKLPFDDETIRKHLKNLLYADTSVPEKKGKVEKGVEGEEDEDEEKAEERETMQDRESQEPRPMGDFPRNFLGRYDEEDDEQPSSPTRAEDDEEEEKEEEEETEVERKRRLAALGLLQETEEDEEDEEDVGRSRSPRIAPISEEDGEASSPKIRWGSDVRKGGEKSS